MIDLKLVKELTSGLSVLIAEDEDELRNSLANTLRLLFKEVDVAEDGRIAYAKYAQKQYDIVISDINMPNMDGARLAKLLRQVNPKQKIIICTAHTDSPLLLDLVRVTVDEFLIKPISSSQLRKVLYQVASSIYECRATNAYIASLEEDIRIMQNEKNNNVVTAPVKATIVSPIITHVVTPNPIPVTVLTPVPEIVNVYKEVQTSVEKESSLSEHYNNISQDDIDEMKDLLFEMDSFVFLGMQQQTIAMEYIEEFSACLIRYGNMLLFYGLFKEVGDYVNTLGRAIRDNGNRLNEKKEYMGLLFENFITTLHMIWSNSFVEESTTPTFYNNSIIADIKTVLAEFNDEVVSNDDCELDFF
ncbi:MAG: response regulator [Sulfurimonas sp.]|jgi:CheY-like chemotaxis protein